jgi:hypothetical protein
MIEQLSATTTAPTGRRQQAHARQQPQTAALRYSYRLPPSRCDDPEGLHTTQPLRVIVFAGNNLSARQHPPQNS